jgi:hypothetical protein
MSLSAARFRAKAEANRIADMALVLVQHGADLDDPLACWQALHNEHFLVRDIVALLDDAIDQATDMIADMRSAAL